MKRIGFYILSFTWGSVLSIVGLIVIAICSLFGRVHEFHGRLYAVLGHNWGGLELGCFFVVCEECKDNEYMCAHEAGHGLQNAIWGPLYLFVIFIPSVSRYWYRELKFNRKGLVPKTGYYDIWFEGQASDWGYKYILTDKF